MECACLLTGRVMGLLYVLWRVGLVTVVVGWKISSYWLDESRCVMRVGQLIFDFVSICKRQGNGFFFLCEKTR